MTSTSAGQITPTTNVGPLPSAIPAGKCNVMGLRTDWGGHIQSSTTTSTLQLERNFANLYGAGGNIIGTCLPEKYFDSVSSKLSPIFGPATACPAGYAPMCTLVAIGATVPAAPTVRLWTALATNDAAIGCCPSGYTCADDLGMYSCASTFQSGESSPFVLLSNWSSTAEIYANAQTTVIVRALKLIYASMQSSTQPSTLPRTESTQRSSEPHTASPQPNNTHTRTGLSLGQKAAIGVCVPLAVLSLLIGLLFIHRRYKRRAAEKTQSKDFAADTFRKSELYGSSKLPIELEAARNAGDTKAAANSSLLLMGLPEAERQHVSPHEIAELPGIGVVPPVSSRAGNPPVVQRKPVAGSQYSPPNQDFSFTGFESHDQSPTTAQDAPNRVVSDVSFVSGENTTPAESKSAPGSQCNS